MARAMEIGRWRERTARIYINTALLALSEDTNLADPRLSRTAKQFQSDLEAFAR